MKAPQVRWAGDDHGAAVVLVVLAATLLLAIGLGLVALGETESMTTWNARGAEEVVHAAEAIAARVVREAAALPSWTPLLDGSYVSGFAGSLTPTTDYGEVLDLVSLTAALQSQWPFVTSWGGNRPVWRLLAHGSMASLAGAGAARSYSFVMAWVADDGAETDGDPRSDANAVISILAEARGIGGARRSVHVALARVCPADALMPVSVAVAGAAPSCVAGQSPVVRVLSWREV